MKRHIASLAWVLFACAPVKPAPLAPLPVARFCVTAGKVDARGPTSEHVDIGGMRGVAPGANGEVAELAFTYRGPSRTTEPLASGELRRQIGLKLRAQDTCNVIYVMWHFEPQPGVAVSVKVNPSQSRHVECIDNGYINLKSHLASEGRAKTPMVKPGERHVLRAEILEHKMLRVTADDSVVFEETLPAAASTFDGPSGVRSDNGELDFELRTPPLAATAPWCVRD